MMSNSKIDKKIDTIIDSAESIEIVNVSPFLKDKILNQIGSEKIETSSVWSWFTPSLQLATLIVFMVLNLFAYMNLNSEDYNSSIDEFTESYGLDEGIDTTMF